MEIVQFPALFYELLSSSLFLARQILDALSAAGSAGINSYKSTARIAWPRGTHKTSTKTKHRSSPSGRRIQL